MEVQECQQIETDVNDGMDQRQTRKRRRAMMKGKSEDGDRPEEQRPEDLATSNLTTDFFNAHFCTEQLEDESLLKRLQSGPGALYAQQTELEALPAGMEGHRATVTSWGHSTTAPTDVAEDAPILEEAITFKRLLRLYRQLPGMKERQIAKQESLYQFMGRYMDICCASREDYTPLICLHLLNHIMRTRNLVVSNKQRLQKAKEQNQLNDDLLEQCRDQGLSRPKVLLLTPFRKFAHRLVCTMRALMFDRGEKPFVQNWQRFDEEFGDAEGNVFHEKRQVPDEHRELMSGNVDDCFRLGIGLAKKCLKLYTSFDESDILLCSPLGLKMLIGGEEEEDAEEEEATKTKKKREKDEGGTHDFLSSIEVLVVERADVLLMQNWEHLQTVLASTNGIPGKIGTDITRVRLWSLRPGIAKHFRQTLLFSHVNFVEMHALFAQHCANYAGQLALIQEPQQPLPIKQITAPNLHEFHRFDATSPEEQADQRMKYFVEQMLPKCGMGTMIFVSSYFDFVRLRNYLKRQTEIFVQLHEYAEPGPVAQARQMFVKGEQRLMLFTERFHFFFRYRIKGIRSLLFYQPPVNPEFYPELVEMASTLGQLKESDQPRSRLQCRLLFCRFDVLRLQNIFGDQATKQLLLSDERVQTLIAN